MFSCLQILEAFLWFVLITLLNVTLIILTLSVSRLLNLLLRLVAFLDRKSGSAGMPRPISYAVFCLKKKTTGVALRSNRCHGSRLRSRKRFEVGVTVQFGFGQQSGHVEEL